MVFIVIFLLLQSFYIFASDDDRLTTRDEIQNHRDTKNSKNDELFEKLYQDAHLPYEAVHSRLVHCVAFARMIQEVFSGERSAQQAEFQKFLSTKKKEVPGEEHTSGAAPAASCSCSDSLVVELSISSKVSVEKELQLFYESRLDFIKKKKPELLPYFDMDILSLLACQLDATLLMTAEDKNLFPVYLWKLFLDTYNELCNKLYSEWISQLKQLYLHKVIPHHLALLEDDLYKKFIKTALRESLSKGLLEYTKDVNAQGVTSFILSPKSKMALAATISHDLKEYISSEVKKYNSLYEPYTEDKALPWVSEFISKNQKLLQHPYFIKGLFIPTIFNRIAYDLSALKKMNIDNKNLATIDDNNPKALSHFYEVFYKTILQGLYKGISQFSNDHSIELEDEKIFSYITDFFESFESNLFRVDHNGRIMPVDGICFLIVDRVTNHFNRHIQELKKTGQKYASVPLYIHHPDRYLSVELQNNSAPIQNSREQSLKELEKKALAAESYQQQQNRLVLQSQEHDKKQQEKTAREAKAAQNKAKREQAEMERQQQAEQEEAARKKREQERKIARDAAAQELCRQRDAQIEKIHEKSRSLYDIEKRIKQLSILFESKKKLEEVQLEIRNKIDRLSKSKDLKKELGLFDNDLLSIQRLIRELEEILEHEEKQKLIELDEQENSSIEQKDRENFVGAPAASCGFLETGIAGNSSDGLLSKVDGHRKKSVSKGFSDRYTMAEQADANLKNSETQYDYARTLCRCLNHNPSMLGPVEECCYCRFQKFNRPMNPEAPAFFSRVHRVYEE